MRLNKEEIMDIKDTMESLLEYGYIILPRGEEARINYLIKEMGGMKDEIDLLFDNSY